MGLLRVMDDLFAGTEHRALSREELRQRLDEAHRRAGEYLREYDEYRRSRRSCWPRKGYDLCNPGECRRVRSLRCD